MRTMRQRRRVLRVAALGLPTLLLACVALSALAGALVAEKAVRPHRRLLFASDERRARNLAHDADASLANVAITTADQVILRAWVLRPRDGNGDAVILLHGHTDNRVGMIGYAALLLKHHFLVLMPDARAHGASGGTLSTWGLRESGDLSRWIDWLQSGSHPRCIYGLGESMGAAQLLQSLRTERRFCAVGAESSFFDLREIAYDRIGRDSRTGPWLGRTLARPAVGLAFFYARSRYGLDLRRVSPAQAAARSSVPLLLIHGASDGNVPLRHSRRIAALDPAAVLWEVPRAHHCGAIGTAPGEFERRLVGWFESNGKVP